MSLNPQNLNLSEDVRVQVSSPSRSTIEFEKPVTDIGSGFFSVQLEAADINQLIDDTYSYKLIQDNKTLKLGYIRLLNGVAEEIPFDMLLDFKMS